MKQRWLCAVGLIVTINVNAAEEVQQLETIEVIGNYQNNVGTSDAASQGIVTPKMFENRPILRPGEVLETVPGLIITQHSGDGKANQYFLRGYNLDHGTDFATYVAGMPINMPSHAHGQGYTDLNFLIPELISRVDYSKGPYFAENGDFGSAGSARISYTENLKNYQGQLTLGQYDFERALVIGGPQLGPGRLIFGAEFQHSDGPWDNPADFTKYNGMLRYAMGDNSNGFNVTGMAYSADWNSTDQIPQSAIDKGITGLYGALDPSDGGKQDRYSLSTEWRRTGDASRTAVNAYVIRSKLNLFSNFEFFLGSPNGDQFEQAEKRLAFGGEANHTWFGKLGGKDMSNKVGLQLRRDRLDPVALYSTKNRQRVDKLDYDGNVIPATTREDRVTESSVGLYFRNEVQWTEWFRHVVGVRGDYFRFNVNSNRPENSGDANDSLVSPKLTLVFGPWAKTEYFVNIGRGFHSNDARGTTITVDPGTGDVVDGDGNPVKKVDPLVKTLGYELGLRSEIIPNVQTSVALWRLKQDSELLFVGDAGITEASRPSLRTGLEWEVHYTPKPWLIFDLEFAAAKARFTDSDAAGDRIPGAVERVISATATVDDLHGWFGALQFRYFGPRPLREDNSFRSRSTAITNVQGGYKFNKHWKLRLDIFNLFDRDDHDIDYAYESRIRDRSGTLQDSLEEIHFHPVEKRSARLTLTATF
jgi:outer membrane receptor protein involved in Fe transport